MKNHGELQHLKDGGGGEHRKWSTVVREVGKPERVTEEGGKAPCQHRNLQCTMLPHVSPASERSGDMA